MSISIGLQLNKNHPFHEIHHRNDHTFLLPPSFDSLFVIMNHDHQNQSSSETSTVSENQGFLAKDEVGDSFLAIRLLKNSPVSSRRPSASDETTFCYQNQGFCHGNLM